MEERSNDAKLPIGEEDRTIFATSLVEEADAQKSNASKTNGNEALEALEQLSCIYLRAASHMPVLRLCIAPAFPRSCAGSVIGVQISAQASGLQGPIWDVRKMSLPSGQV